MTGWRWIPKQALLRLHEASLAQFGGAPGIRDEGLLESALARPENLLAYGEPDLAELAAAYAFGLARNQAFVDGNKRAAFVALGLFLGLNGRRLTASQTDATMTMLALASSDISEAELAVWIRANSQAA